MEARRVKDDEKRASDRAGPRAGALRGGPGSPAIRRGRSGQPPGGLPNSSGDGTSACSRPCARGGAGRVSRRMPPATAAKAEQRERLLALGADVERAWHCAERDARDPQTHHPRRWSSEIIVRVEDDTLSLVHPLAGWRSHGACGVRKNRAGQHRWGTAADVVELVTRARAPDAGPGDRRCAQPCRQDDGPRQRLDRGRAYAACAITAISHHTAMANGRSAAR